MRVWQKSTPADDQISRRCDCEGRTWTRSIACDMASIMLVTGVSAPGHECCLASAQKRQPTPPSSCAVGVYLSSTNRPSRTAQCGGSAAPACEIEWIVSRCGGESAHHFPKRLATFGADGVLPAAPCGTAPSKILSVLLAQSSEKITF
eukprot:2821113-Pleurochrysis_carterae.AAC.9